MGRPLAWLVRLFGYLFHTVLAVFLCGLALVAFLGGKHNLRLDVLPWEGKVLTASLAALGLFGLLSVAFAVAGKTRLLLIVQSLGVAGLLIRGLFASPMPLDGDLLNVKGALLLTVSALLALCGAFSKPRPTRG